MVTMLMRCTAVLPTVVSLRVHTVRDHEAPEDVNIIIKMAKRLHKALREKIFKVEFESHTKAYVRFLLSASVAVQKSCCVHVMCAAAYAARFRKRFAIYTINRLDIALCPALPIASEFDMDSEMVSLRPLYAQLRATLVGRIAAGHWKSGDRLPNETELSREYGVSPGTVRMALDGMERARMIVRQQGRGTFVRDASSEECLSRYERLRAEDGAPVSDRLILTGVVIAGATEFECTRLSLRPGDKVRRSQRVRAVDGEPYMVETMSVPASLFPLPEGEQIAELSLLKLAAGCGVVLGRGEERVTAILAGEAFAARLNCAPSEPLLRMDRTVYTIEGRPAKWRVAHCKLNGKFYSASIGSAV